MVVGTPWMGAAYAVTQPFSAFAFLEGARVVVPGQSDPLDVRVGAEYRLTRALTLTGSVILLRGPLSARHLVAINPRRRASARHGEDALASRRVSRHAVRPKPSVFE